MLPPVPEDGGERTPEPPLDPGDAPAEWTGDPEEEEAGEWRLVVRPAPPDELVDAAWIERWFEGAV